MFDGVFAVFILEMFDARWDLWILSMMYLCFEWECMLDVFCDGNVLRIGWIGYYNGFMAGVCHE